MVKATDVRKLTKKLSVLYVEDEKNIRQETSENLRHFFKNVYSGENGEKGLELFKKNKEKIDIVISDIQMPKLDGLDMIVKIKEEVSDITIMVISAHNEISLFSKAISIGVDGFLIKPIKTALLLESLHKMAKIVINQKENETYKTELEDLVRRRTSQLEKEIITDQLTGLPNYRRLNQVIKEEKVAEVILINLDNFDHVNTSYGYQFGDKLLQEFAEHCKKDKPKESELFRLNSDEFVLVFKKKSGRLSQIGKMINSQISHTVFTVEGIEMSLTATIGMAHSGGKNILRNAHIAMREVRQIGKNHYFLYDKNDSMIEATHRKNILWSKKVKKAIKSSFIIPYYQPIVDNKTKKIIKYESLARMLDVTEVISPSYFIEPALLMGMITGITKIMINKTFEDFTGNNLGFSINITEDDLLENYMAEYLLKKSKKYKIAPKRVTLEILENISDKRSSMVFEQIAALQKLDFKISLDDFGSEKSNFQRLHKLNVDYIKIDGMYIKDIDVNENSQKIVKSIVTLAHSVGAKVIAEFVHSEAVFKMVKKLKVDYSQGYYFGPPAEKIPITQAKHE